MADISFACPNVIYDSEVTKNSVFTTMPFLYYRENSQENFSGGFFSSAASSICRHVVRRVPSLAEALIDNY